MPRRADLPGQRPAGCPPLRLDTLPDGPHGRHTEVWQDPGGQLGLAEVLEQHRQGRFTPGTQPVLDFGIEAAPVWVRLSLFNPYPAPQPLHLIAGAPWIDQLDLHLLHAGQTQHWRHGDAFAGAEGLRPALGFTFDLQLPPGHSTLYLRASTSDPMLLPVELLNPAQLALRERQQHYSYGLLYGFLLALVAYNFLLFLGLRKRSHGYYSIYLCCFILVNLAYTGHGFAWIWPQLPLLQRHVILNGMALFGACGVLFSCRFLTLALHAPRVNRLSLALAGLGLASVAGASLLGQPGLAAHLSFSLMLLIPLCMVLLGAYSVHQGHAAGRYYLIAVCCGMFGLVSTTLSVWGLLPFNQLSYRAVELGLLLEATLLAMALAYRVRKQQQARLQAEEMARHDSLTGLYNRRGFVEQAASLWSTAVRNGRPLALIMLDIDHFKRINDQYGHDMGDATLQASAELLRQTCRTGDVLARWGGEEFLLLLPETGLDAALALAERLRLALERLELPQGIRISASLGVVPREAQERLENLINAADQRLYQAKQNGRNRVCGPGQCACSEPAA